MNAILNRDFILGKFIDLTEIGRKSKLKIDKILFFRVEENTF